MKTGKNNRFLASILAASMMLTMSPFAFAADETEQKEMTTQEQVQSAAQNETNANPAVSQMDSQSSEDTNSEAPKTEGQSPKDTNSEGGQPSKDVKLARSARKRIRLLLTRLLMHSRTTPSFCSVMLRRISPSISL